MTKNVLVVSDDIIENNLYKVHSVFKNTFNIRVGKELIVVTNNPKYKGEKTIYTSIHLGNYTSKILKGSDFMLGKDYVLIGKDLVKVDEKNLYRPSFKNIRLKNPRALIDFLYKYLLENNMEANISLHKSLKAYIFKEEIIRAIEFINFELKKDRIDFSYIGLGHGLTPCIDDYLLGLIFMSKISHSEFHYGEIIAERTTEISYQMLENAKNNIFYELFYVPVMFFFFSLVLYVIALL